MKIQILGTGCTTCKNLYELTKEVINEIDKDSEVEHVTDVSKMIEMGIMTSPALVIDGKVAMNGGTNDADKIKDLIAEYKKIIFQKKKNLEKRVVSVKVDAARLKIIK